MASPAPGAGGGGSGLQSPGGGAAGGHDYIVDAYGNRMDLFSRSTLFSAASGITRPLESRQRLDDDDGHGGHDRDSVMGSPRTAHYPGGGGGYRGYGYPGGAGGFATHAGLTGGSVTSSDSNGVGAGAATLAAMGVNDSFQTPARAGAGAGTSAGAAQQQAHAGTDADADPGLVNRLVREVGRRTEALRQCGVEIQSLRREVRGCKDTIASMAAQVDGRERERQDADEVLLLSILRGVGPATLLAPSNIGGAGYSDSGGVDGSPYGFPLSSTSSTSSSVLSSSAPTMQAASSASILASMRQIDPTGSTIIPTLLRRLTLLAQRYVQQRRANAAVCTEVYNLRAKVRELGQQQQRQQQQLSTLVADDTAGGHQQHQHQRRGHSLDSSAVTRTLPLSSTDSSGTLTASASAVDGIALQLLASEISMSSAPSSSSSSGVGSRAMVPYAFPPGDQHGAMTASSGMARTGAGAGLLSVTNAGAPAASLAGPFTSALVSGHTSLDPTAPVSALTHARLLDAYSQLSSEVDRYRDTAAHAHAQLQEVQAAHQTAVAALRGLQHEVRGSATLRQLVTNQQGMMKQLDKALHAANDRVDRHRDNEKQLTQQVQRLEARLASAQSRTRDDEEEDAARDDARSHIHHLQQQLRSRDARIEVLEEQLSQSSRAFGLQLSAAQSSIIAMEQRLSRSERESGALRAAVGWYRDRTGLEYPSGGSGAAADGHADDDYGAGGAGNRARGRASSTSQRQAPPSAAPAAISGSLPQNQARIDLSDPDLAALDRMLAAIGVDAPPHGPGSEAGEDDGSRRNSASGAVGIGGEVENRNNRGQTGATAGAAGGATPRPQQQLQRSGASKPPLPMQAAAAGQGKPFSRYDQLPRY